MTHVLPNHYDDDDDEREKIFADNKNKNSSIFKIVTVAVKQ